MFFDSDTIDFSTVNTGAEFFIAPTGINGFLTELGSAVGSPNDGFSAIIQGFTLEEFAAQFEPENYTYDASVAALSSNTVVVFETDAGEYVAMGNWERTVTGDNEFDWMLV